MVFALRRVADGPAVHRVVRQHVGDEDERKNGPDRWRYAMGVPDGWWKGFRIAVGHPEGEFHAMETSLKVPRLFDCRYDRAYQ